MRRSLAGVVLLASILALTAAPASAHTKLSPRPTCPGGELPHQDFFNGQISAFLYFSSVANGTNCVWAQKNVNRGTPESLNIRLEVCATGNPANPCNPGVHWDDDPGQWQYYAGPVTLSNAAGKCIVIRVTYRGQTGSRGPFHCG
jgi:hypothetical protein